MNKQLTQVGDFLSVVAAAIVFLAAMFSILMFVDAKFGEEAPEWLMKVAALISICVVMPIIFILFNIRFGGEDEPCMSTQLVIYQLEQSGALEPQHYVARRVFEVEQFEDEGSQYFLELDDGRVLFLMGQYLWDYEPKFDNGNTIPRQFPASSFVLRRHRDLGYAIDIITDGEVLEPEVCAPHFTVEDYESDRVPDDGEIISDLTYDEVKERIVNRVPLRP